MKSFDALTLKAFIQEQNSFFAGSKINKIQQPTRREIIFSLRNQGKTRQLYVNIDPQFYHVCFMSEENQKKRHIEIPQKPPMFCMLLRKYLNNARIAKIFQPDYERILEIYVESYNEIGDKIYLCLAIELMGKYSNIILYNCDTNIILGCAHNVGADKSQVREVYGTIPYTYPPKQDSEGYLRTKYASLLSNSSLDQIVDKIYPQGVNSAVDNYYAEKIEQNKIKSLQNTYLHEINNNLKKVEKSLNEMQQQLQKYKSSDRYRLYGDLIMANLYNLKDYSATVNVYDYENDKQISINLNPLKSLKDNANLFYKKYNKSKTANIKLAELIEQALQKKSYFEHLLYSISIASNLDELLDIKYEMKNEKSAEKPENNIIKIELENETRIYIGKNNRQNDYIVSKLAKDEDLWFHTKDCPGSHVLLKTQNLTDELILKCANLAKNYSVANSSKVGVIYTKSKYVKKPPKANLGYVTYRNEKEIIID
ncbi:NFACT family protein [bacterium]|nr:NFACT family protein [bacterium]